MLHKIDIKKEEKQLFSAFEACLQEVQTDPFYELFAKEKIHHSMQVVGVGNYILKNEKRFQNRSDNYLKLGKLVNLFHDIGRFIEISLLFENSQSEHDHGFYSYEKLKELGYDDLRLLLPIKQHGHLADALENDAEYQAVSDPILKKEIEEMFFLVRDADKIANLYLIKNDGRVFEDLFLEGQNEETKYAPTSPIVLQAFEKKILVKSSDRHSFTDRLMQLICFGFEIYYKPSWDYILRHGLFEHIFSIMRKYNPDKELQQHIEESFNLFVEKRYQKL